MSYLQTTFELDTFEVKPDSTSYILENRKKFGRK